MEVELKHRPSFSLAVVGLAPNEEIRVEPGAMVSYSDGVTVETKAEGGLLGGLKRMFTGESFFINKYSAPAQGGEMTLAPALAGDMMVMEISGDLLLQSGAFIASEASVQVDSTWGGAKGFFGGGGLILLKISGVGKLLAGCYGAIEERILQPGQRYIVDTGHIVALDSSINFQVKRVGGWKSTILSGEGLVCELTGPGRILMQSRSEEALIGWISSHMPTQNTN